MLSDHDTCTKPYTLKTLGIVDALECNPMPPARLYLYAVYKIAISTWHFVDIGSMAWLSWMRWYCDYRVTCKPAIVRMSLCKIVVNIPIKRYVKFCLFVHGLKIMYCSTYFLWTVLILNIHVALVISTFLYTVPNLLCRAYILCEYIAWLVAHIIEADELL